MRAYGAALMLVLAMIGWGQVQEHAITPMKAQMAGVTASLDCAYPGSGCQ